MGKLNYQRINQKAEVAFFLEAPSWSRLFIDTALAFLDHWVRVERVQAVSNHKLQLEGKSKEDLLEKFLREAYLLTLKYRFMVSGIILDQFDGSSLKATLWGEPYDPAKHGSLPDAHDLQFQQLQLGESLPPSQGVFARVVL